MRLTPHLVLGVVLVIGPEGIDRDLLHLPVAIVSALSNAKIVAPGAVGSGLIVLGFRGQLIWDKINPFFHFLDDITAVMEEYHD